VSHRFPGPILVLLPKQWRESLPDADSVHWREAAQVSGLAQASLMLAAYIAWFLYSMGHWARNAIVASMKAHSTQAIGLGMFITFGFILVALSPVTWVIWYFAWEGLLRVLKARAMETTSGTLPLRLFANARRLAKHGRWSETPRLIEDEVTRGERGWDLTIASCRPKQHWKYPLTIRYKGEFFQVQGEEHLPAGRERPHLYLFKRLPANEIIRGLEEYNPENVVHEESSPGIFATVAGELRKKWANAAASDERVTDRR
jgi:hypothetical protein